jgi:hypothetical protein
MRVVIFSSYQVFLFYANKKTAIGGFLFDYRFDQVGALRAFFKPNFFRST